MRQLQSTTKGSDGTGSRSSPGASPPAFRRHPSLLFAAAGRSRGIQIRRQTWLGVGALTAPPVLRGRVAVVRSVPAGGKALLSGRRRDLFNFGRHFQLKNLFSFLSVLPVRCFRRRVRRPWQCGASISSGASLSPLLL
jgi:hypothetical protein